MCCGSFWKKIVPFGLALMISYYVVDFVKQWSFANENKVNVSQTTKFPQKIIYPYEESGSGCGECFLLQLNEQNCFVCKDGKFKPYVEFKLTKKLSSEAGKVQLIRKPIAKYTNEARQNQIQGTVRLRATLSSEGEIKNIVPVTTLPFGLTEQAMAAAQQIKFRPAVKNGKPISKVVVLEYNFTIY